MFVQFNEKNRSTRMLGILGPDDNKDDFIEVDDSLMSSARLILDNNNVRPMTESEHEVELEELKISSTATRVRQKRDVLLAASDVLVLPDRWALYTKDQQTTVAQYRDALRTLPDQEGFPLDVVFPDEPIL